MILVAVNKQAVADILYFKSSLNILKYIFFCFSYYKESYKYAYNSLWQVHMFLNVNKDICNVQIQLYVLFSFISLQYSSRSCVSSSTVYCTKQERIGRNLATKEQILQRSPTEPKRRLEQEQLTEHVSVPERKGWNVFLIRSSLANLQYKGILCNSLIMYGLGLFHFPFFKNWGYNSFLQ